VACTLFSAVSNFVGLRECYFTLLILSNWEISQSERGLFCIADFQQMEDFSRICADHKASATQASCCFLA